MLELARIRKENKEEDRELDIRKEAFGLILRSSQRYHSVKDSSEIVINGIHCLHLRLEKGVAQQIYGTSNIPILSNKDSVTVKFFREAHWVKGDVCRGMHNLTKTTLSNVLRGEAAVFWKGQQRQIKNAILDCGTCRKFSEKLCRPYLGKSMFRCRVGSPPFEYVSIDPLGSVRVQMTGSHSGKITPLIVCDLNTGAVAIQHMLGVRAEHVYTALQCLQYRFGTDNGLHRCWKSVRKEPG